MNCCNPILAAKQTDLKLCSDVVETVCTRQIKAVDSSLVAMSFVGTV